ncbi:putative transposase [Klebsiella pneumoniae]|nr:putative transposase [Klebsiella pneumoniae]
MDVDWLIAERPGRVKTLKQHPRKNKTAINIEYMKASIRAKVEHPFRIIKRQFGFVKARYKGLLKNDNQLAMLFTLANLFRVDQMIRQWERSPVKTGNNARNGGKNSLNRLIRLFAGKKIGPDPRNFNQRVSLGRNDLLIRTFPNASIIMVVM